MSRFIAAAVQMTSGDDVSENIKQAAPLIDKAVDAGAKFVALPENAFYMRREGTNATADGPMAEHKGVRWAQATATLQQIWILVGSIRAKEAGMAMATNRSVLVSPEGKIAAFYDKLHLFDVDVKDGHSYRESAQVLAGETHVLAKTPLANFGFSVCYDVRFPYLYRDLAQAGADVLCVPSAFTRPTGEAHWQVLLRARAIENACFVIAPAQAGRHPGGRETHGHSMIVDPWGNVLAEALEDKPGVITAEIDTARGLEVRAQIPVLQHHRQLGAIKIFE